MSSRKEHVHHVFGEAIHFPFEPYKTQLILISKVLQAIKQSKNTLLESPTGTGKTIAVLSAVLAWKERNPDLNTQIIYASRTHSQLSQLIKELEQSPHSKKISAVCLASKKHYCIHKQVSKSDYLNKECSAIKHVSCAHFFAADKNAKTIAQKKLILDIEDLVKYSKQSELNACPYFTAKKLANESNTIIFCPYNYILDPCLFILLCIL